MERDAGVFVNAHDVTPFVGDEYEGRNAEINLERMNNIPEAYGGLPYNPD